MNFKNAVTSGWTLFTVIVSSAVSGYNNFDSLVSAALFLPSIAVGCRRMHDTGRRGWWQLLPIFSLVFACQKSSPEMNEFGPPPPPKS
ncbi:MAG: DUF805 domain-containing protein [Actinobacteria bacterium]|nr:DUF805 domain-containing protein [Actinomycetota bacterium]